ncbi:MAG: DUF3108 domain-containing protein [Pseudomonadota bacterium]
MRHFIVAGLCAFLSTAALAVGGPNGGSASYAVQVAGITVGQMNITAREDNRGYAAAIEMRSTGLAAAFAKYRFVASVQGRRTASGSMSPQRYVEDSDTGRRQSNLTMTYSGGVPSPAPRDPDATISAASQRGTIDPMSAVFALFRDQSSAEICRGNHDIYDGSKRTRLSLSRGQQSGDRMICAATFTRVAGFSADRLAEGTSFPMRLEYVERGGVYELDRLTVDSARGRARFLRR